MFRIQLLIVTALALIVTGAQAQITFKDLLGEKPPVGVDTLYYPFYNDVQMIEIDNVGAWERNVNWHEQVQPRALSWSMLIPGPFPNVYLFRDKSGRIVKAFNTRESLDALTTSFAKIPIDKKSSGIHSLVGAYHKRKYHSGWGDYRSRMIDFNGYYKVYDTTSLYSPKDNHWQSYGSVATDRMGLIDSMGNFFLPIEYTVLVPLNDYILTAKDGKCGMMNRQKEYVIPMEHDNYNVESQDEVNFFTANQVTCIYRMDREKIYTIDHFDYIATDAMRNARYNRSSFRQPYLFHYRKDGLTGLLDTNYNVVTAAKYEFMSWFLEGKAIACRDGKFGYVDEEGKEVIECRYTYAEYFRKGVSVVQYKGEFRNIDSTGKLMNTTERKHEEWRNSRYPQAIGNLNVVQTTTGYGLTNSKEEFVVPPVYAQIRPLMTFIPPKIPGHGRTVGPEPTVFLAKKFHDDQWGLFSTSGKQLLACEYELIADYPSDRGFRAVKKDDKHWGMINRKYELVVPCIYEGVSMGHADTDIKFHENGKVGIMDTTGKIIVPAVYSQLYNEENGRLMAIKDSLYGFIDPKGNVLIPFSFQQLHGKFENGLCAAMIKGKWGFIDTTGTFVIAAQYDEVRRFQSEITGVKLNGKWGFINRKGKLVVDYQYEFVGHEWEFDNTCKVQNNGLIGFVNATGKEVIPCIYKDAWGSSREKGHYLEKDGVKMWVKPE